MQTIYSFAEEQMQEIVTSLLELSQKTQNFTEPPSCIWKTQNLSEFLLCGKGFYIEDLPSLKSFENSWKSRLGIPFNIESAATGVLYKRIKGFTDNLIDKTFKETSNFKKINSDWIQKNPFCLPVFMHVAGSFSKQELQKQIGSASDNLISKKAAEKICVLLVKAEKNGVPNIERIRERIKSTVEGIVRDLVGRLLLEQFVASALSRNKVPFKRESEYENLEGVIYDFRADFVIPDEKAPKAFIEVRKSSSRHASLYAKDKMFSAINWKGQHQECLGVLVIDGPWTEITLQIMARVFDYIVPINQVDEVAIKIREYLKGDKTVLQWFINFSIQKFNPKGKMENVPKIKIKDDDFNSKLKAD